MRWARERMICGPREPSLTSNTTARMRSWSLKRSLGIFWLAGRMPSAFMSRPIVAPWAFEACTMPETISPVWRGKVLHLGRTLRFANTLLDHLAGGLGCHTAEVRGRGFDDDHIPQLRFRIHFAGILQSDLGLVFLHFFNDFFFGEDCRLCRSRYRLWPPPAEPLRH